MPAPALFCEEQFRREIRDLSDLGGGVRSRSDKPPTAATRRPKEPTMKLMTMTQVRVQVFRPNGSPRYPAR
jgi:hypothetical protein